MKKKLIILIAIILGVSLFLGCKVTNNTNTISYKLKEESKKIKLDELTTDFEVLNAKEVKSIGTNSNQINPKGKFIVIEILLKNISKENINYSPISLQLINNGYEYHLDENSFEALKKLISQEILNDKKCNYIRPYTVLAPGETKKSFVIFDVPKDLKLKDSKLIVNKNEEIRLDIDK